MPLRAQFAHPVKTSLHYVKEGLHEGLISLPAASLALHYRSGWFLSSYRSPTLVTPQAISPPNSGSFPLSFIAGIPDDLLILPGLSLCQLISGVGNRPPKSLPFKCKPFHLGPSNFPYHTHTPDHCPQPPDRRAPLFTPRTYGITHADQSS